MSLSVHTYITHEDEKMILQEPKKHSETMAGGEAWRTSVYGSDLAKKLGLTLLPILAVKDIYAKGAHVNKLKAEAEVIMNEAAAFAEQAGLDEDYVREKVDNIRKACIRARHVHGNVVIW